MTPEGIKAHIVDTVPRDLVIDLIDAAEARTRQAHELIRDNTDLTGRRARGLEGQARFRLMEKGFQDALERHGAIPLEGDLIPGTNLRCYQPFMRLGGNQPGILLGLASMPAPRELPTKNCSRVAGVTLNYCLMPRLDLDGDGRTAKLGDIFVLFLFARDPSHGGRLEEVAIGVVDAEFQNFLFYEPVETFMAAFAPPAVETGPEQAGRSPLVTRKKLVKTFIPSEQPSSDMTAK